MFLNNKSLLKIWLLVGAYLALATLCFLFEIIFVAFEIEGSFHIIVGCFCLVAAPLFYAWGRWAEGKGKLLNKGNQLIFHQLKPAEFIHLYEQRRDDPSNIVAKPDYQVLQMLVAAYDALDDHDLALVTMDQALTVAPEKHRNRALIIKCSLLFNYGKLEEADALYRELSSKELDFMCKTLMDAVIKSDRAMLLGDVTTAEAYYRQAMNQSFPKPTPLSLLYYHYHLAKICYKTNRREEAEEHRNYCIENGGETGSQRKAATGEIFA